MLTTADVSPSAEEAQRRRAMLSQSPAMQHILQLALLHSLIFFIQKALTKVILYTGINCQLPPTYMWYIIESN